MTGRTVAIVQARVGSSRFPRKVLEPLLGEPLILRVVERARRARSIDEVVVATTTSEGDDELAAVLSHAGCRVVRGSEDDVLERFAVAAREADAEVVVRLTGDCPLLDPALVDEAVVAWRESQPEVDFVSNALSETYPDGVDVEVFSRDLLERASREARLPSEREHVTFYFWKTGLFEVKSLVSPQPLGHLRLTVDHPEDLDVVRQLYERLYPVNPGFGLRDIVDAITGIDASNARFDRNAGWQRALERDRHRS